MVKNEIGTHSHFETLLNNEPAWQRWFRMKMISTRRLNYFAD
jgi:hypothetical protein